jgi:NADPH-dependent 2,4-dienoyl-CoA reductase/sulfur reductase-like enzyme
MNILHRPPASAPLPSRATVDVAVVGAGPAGMAAAVAAAELGLRVAILEEQPRLGGQYLALDGKDASTRRSPAQRQGERLRGALGTLPVEVWTGALVWNFERSGELHVYHGGRVSTLSAGAVVLACGGRELSIPFPGWTLPGVMTVGAGQLLAKHHDVLPGKRVLLAGSGPLLLAAACEMIRLGAQVAGVLEASDPRRWLRHAPAMWSQWERLVEGLGYLRRMRQAGVPYRFGRAVVAAYGHTRVERVDIAALDAGGRPRLDTVEQIAVDALCVSFGLTPNIELAQLAGAALAFDPRLGGWIPRVDAGLQTTVPGLFAAGETATVAGADAALITGHLAGLAAARHLGRLPEDEWETAFRALAGKRRAHARFGRALNTLFAPPPGLHSIMTDETIVCRCEEVCAGEIRAATAAGAQTLDALKTWTRVGQGRCQGRTCGPVLARLIAAQSGRPLAEILPMTVRPPVKPIPVAALATAQLDPNPAPAGALLL